MKNQRLLIFSPQPTVPDSRKAMTRAQGGRSWNHHAYVTAWHASSPSTKAIMVSAGV